MRMTLLLMALLSLPTFAATLPPISVDKELKCSIDNLQGERVEVPVQMATNGVEGDVSQFMGHEYFVTELIFDPTFESQAVLTLFLNGQYSTVRYLQGRRGDAAYSVEIPDQVRLQCWPE